MSLGWRNPLPFEVGGGPTSTEVVYDALRGALGTGGTGKPDELRDLWFQSRAKAIAKAEGRVEGAMLQAFPSTMTSALAGWEEVLQIPTEATLPARQRAVTLGITAKIDATIPGLRRGLQRIDPAFDIELLPWSLSVTVQAGKVFEQHPGTGGAAFGTGAAAGRRSTAWPNFSDAFVVHARYFLQAGQTDIPAAILAAAEEYLNDQLPSWVDFSIYNLASGPDGDGFYLDGGPNDDSLLDQTAF